MPNSGQDAMVGTIWLNDAQRSVSTAVRDSFGSPALASLSRDEQGIPSCQRPD
jgi:hypothetical protein